jgi:hypothetical protein
LDEPYLDGTLVSKESKNVANTEKAGVFCHDGRARDQRLTLSSDLVS